MKSTSLKHFKWLKSIRVLTTNGYLCDEDCERIQEYFLEEIKRTVQELFVKEVPHN